MGIVLYLIMEKNILSFVGIDILSNNILLLISILFGAIIYFLSSFLFGVEQFYEGKWNQKKWQMI